MPIHSFWVEQLPQFADQQFIYYFLDIITILTILRFMFEFPRLLLNRKRGVL